MILWSPNFVAWWRRGLKYTNERVNQKKGFYSGPIIWDSYFGLWVVGPHNFPCCVGWVPLPFQKASGSSFSPQISLISVDLHLFLLTFSQFCTMHLNFDSFYASGFFIDPQFFSHFIFRAGCGTPVMLLSLRGSGFGKQLPPNIGSL